VTSITWLGHSTTLIETAGQRMLTDPVLRAGIGPVRRRADRVDLDVATIDAVLVSHLHHDHFDLKSLAMLPGRATIVVPRGAGPLLGSRFERVEQVSPGDNLRLGDVKVTAVHAEHSGRRLPLGPSAPALGFVVDGDHRTYFAGDTALFPAMADLSPGLDVALLPVGGWAPTLRGGHMDPLEAAAALRLLRPRFAIPIHWGTLWPIGLGRVRRDRFEGPAGAFVEAGRTAAPDVTVVVLEPGGGVVIP
jgi:L-ascorbate metabolism protein UlaG (beta-lactamase superfamily)